MKHHPLPFTQNINRFFALLAVLFLGIQVVLGENIQYPTGIGPAEGFHDVTSYGAVGNGIADDTAAIQAAIDAAKDVRDVVYFPNGTYKVTDSLITYSDTTTATASHPNCRVTFQGQSRDGVVIQLPDNAPGFNSSASSPKAVIETWAGSYNSSGGGTTWNNFNFSINIFNLTVDVGASNPNAIGIVYLAHNQGTIKDVKVISSDPGYAGSVGVNMSRETIPGPAFLKNVEVVGFDYGITFGSDGNYCMVMEHITLSNQLVAGIENTNVPVTIRGLQSTNTVPAVINNDYGFLALIDSTLSGGSGANAAIVNQESGTTNAFVYLRDITVSGYGTDLDDRGTSVALGAGVEYVSGGVNKAFPSAPNGSLDLPIEETPDTFWDVPANWQSVTDPSLANPATPDNGADDDSIGIQQAIEAMKTNGRTTLYFPAGKYVLDNPVVLEGGSLRRVTGTGGALLVTRVGLDEDYATTMFRVEDTAPGQPLFIDRLNITDLAYPWMAHGMIIANYRQDPLVLKHIFNGHGAFYQGHTDSKVYIEDVASMRTTPNKGNDDDPLQRPKMDFGMNQVWARQLDPELDSTLMTGEMVRISGGSLWVLGFKTEGSAQVFSAFNGSQVELIGGSMLPGEHFQSDPGLDQVRMLTVDNSTASMVMATHKGPNKKMYTNLIEERQTGFTTEIITSSELPQRTPGSPTVPLYRSLDASTPTFVHYPFFTQNGQVVIEAENYKMNTPQDPYRAPGNIAVAHEWTEQNDAAASGGTAMGIAENGEILWGLNDPANNGDNHGNGTQDEFVRGARMDYPIYLHDAGTYYVWVRLSSMPSSTNWQSVHVGLDGEALDSAMDINFNAPAGSWNWGRARNWNSQTADATITVDQAGLHELNIWMRADGAILDKIVLTNDVNFTPSGMGPAESPRATNWDGTLGYGIVSSDPANGYLDASYDFEMSVSGGVSPYSWSISSGSLPTGLTLSSLNSIGNISGTPTTMGSFPFTVQVTDSSSPTPQTTSENYVIEITDPGVPDLLPATLANALEAHSYSESLTVNNGAPPYNITISSGSLPDGLSLNASTGAIEGKPTETGAFAFTVNVSDSLSNSDSESYNLTVDVLPRDVYINQIGSSPVIDGSVDAIWSSFTSVGLGNTIQGSSGAPNLAGTFKVAFDSTNLYLLAEVTDDALWNDSTPYWQDDSVELYLDIGFDRNSEATGYGSDDFQYQLGYNDTVANETKHSPSSIAGVVLASASTGSGYVLEVSIPWTSLNTTTPVDGTLFGFDVHICDDDDGGSTRENKISLKDTIDQAWINPSLFGVAEVQIGGTPSAPAAPSGLAATVQSSSQIDLTWTDNASNEDSFSVEYRVSGGAFSVYTSVGANVTSTPVTGLSADTTYDFRVQAVNGGGSSAYSNTATETTSSSGTPTSRTVSVNFRGSAEASSHSVPVNASLVGPSPAGYWNNVTATASGDSHTGLTYNDGSAIPGSFSVDVSSSVNRTFQHGIVSGTAAEQIVKSFYEWDGTGNPYAGAITLTNLNDAITSSSGYDVYLILGCSSAGNRTVDVTINGVTQSMTGNADSYSSWTEGTNYVKFSGLTNSTLSIQLGSSFWNKHGIGGIQIVGSSSGTPPATYALTVNSGSGSGSYTAGSSVPVSADTPPAGQEFAGWTGDTSGLADPGAESTTLTMPASNVTLTATYVDLPPAAPSGLAASVQSSSQIDLTWTDNASNEDSFSVEYRVSGGTFSVYTSVGGNETGASVTGLSADTTYDFRVQAVNGGGSSGYSNTATETTLGSSPDPIPPGGVSVNSGGGLLTIGFNSISGQTYILEGADSLSGPWSDVDGVDPVAGDDSPQSFEVAAPLPGSRAFYRIRTE